MLNIGVCAIALAVLQAISLSRAPPSLLPWLLVAQTAAGLVPSRARSTRGATLSAVALQAGLYTTALVAPVAARAIHHTAGGHVPCALVKTLAPLVALAAQPRRVTLRQCVGAVVAYVGFTITTWAGDTQEVEAVIDATWTTAHLLLLVSMVAGVALGVAQQRAACGPCWTEMALVATTQLAAYAAAQSGAPTGAQLAGCSAHFVLSVGVQHAVRAYSQAVRHDAIALTAMLGMRRAISVALESCIMPAPARYIALLGATLALLGTRQVEPRRSATPQKLNKP